MIKLEIKGRPITKKNSQKIVKCGKYHRIVQSDAYRLYETAALWQLKSQCKGKPIVSHVNVKCVYYMPTRHRVDLTNLIAATNDILVKAKILSDDNANIVVSHDGSRVRYDKDNPRAEIEITRNEDM